MGRGGLSSAAIRTRSSPGSLRPPVRSRDAPHSPAHPNPNANRMPEGTCCQVRKGCARVPGPRGPDRTSLRRRVCGGVSGVWGAAVLGRAPHGPDGGCSEARCQRWCWVCGA